MVADRLRRKSFDQAWPLIEEAVRALLRLKTGEAWDPRGTLLISHPALRYWSERPAGVFRLLESWRKVATGLGQDELACALELQVAVGRRWADGDAALEAFRRVPSPRFASMRDRLPADCLAGHHQEATAAVSGPQDGGAPGAWPHCRPEGVQHSPRTADELGTER